VYQLWIDALRSGKYKQTQGTLKNDEGFCCLGVLCDLARLDGGPHWEKDWTENYFLNNFGDLPKVVKEFMGLDEGDVARLINKNDNQEQSFEQIANFIETDLMPKNCKDDGQ
jgi:hypothetical protein